MIESIPTSKLEESALISSQIDEFLASGGKIQHLEYTPESASEMHEAARPVKPETVKSAIKAHNEQRRLQWLAQKREMVNFINRNPDGVTFRQIADLGDVVYATARVWVNRAIEQGEKIEARNCPKEKGNVVKVFPVSSI